MIVAAVVLLGVLPAVALIGCLVAAWQVCKLWREPLSEPLPVPTPKDMERIGNWLQEFRIAVETADLDGELERLARENG